MAQDQLRSFKELAILEYLSKIDFKNDKWTPAMIQADLKRILQENPGVDIEWMKTTRVNEILDTEEVTERVRSITVVYTTDARRAGEEPTAGQVTIMV